LKIFKDGDEERRERASVRILGLGCNGGRENRGRERKRENGMDLREEDAAKFYRLYRLPINSKMDQTAQKTLILSTVVN
jgi:hypothetical protein